MLVLSWSAFCLVVAHGDDIAVGLEAAWSLGANHLELVVRVDTDDASIQHLLEGLLRELPLGAQCLLLAELRPQALDLNVLVRRCLRPQGLFLLQPLNLGLRSTAL